MAWLKPYNEFNTEQREYVSSPFQKYFFQLMNNSVYGKSVESVRRRADIQLVNKDKKNQKSCDTPALQKIKFFDENLIGVERMKYLLTLNKPLYAGFIILELSKFHIYKFHCDFLTDKYGDKAKLMFRIPIFFTYHIEIPDIQPWLKVLGTLTFNTILVFKAKTESLIVL